MVRGFTGFLLVLVAVGSAVSEPRSGCNGTPKKGKENLFPILDYPSVSQVIKTVQNGKLVQVNVANSGGNTSSTFTVVHVYGSSYQMGYAQGQLLGSNIITFMNRMWVHMEQQIEGGLSKLPTWLSEWIANLGLDVALDLTAEATRAYTSDHFFEELQGLVDGSGGDDAFYKMAYRVHMIAGLTQGHCSMYGAWGAAVANTPNKLVQLRALDWDMDAPVRDYSSVTVYHPSNKTEYGNNFINIGMQGFLGSLTGLSEQLLSISEIGASYPNGDFGTESRIGEPFIFVLRDILQWDVTVDSAITRLANTKRTCDLMLGVGDGKMSEFRGFAYSSSQLLVFDDANLRPLQSWHPRIQDVVYWGMDWWCPAYNTLLSNQLIANYGNISGPVGVRYISAQETSGDNHLAIYEYPRAGGANIYVSFAAPLNVSGPGAAYDRQFVKIDAVALMQEPL